MNAIGLEGGRVVSASGDGRMMLWDAASGRCERVFEGHERGLACIEFKVCCLIFLPPTRGCCSLAMSFTDTTLIGRPNPKRVK